MKRRHTGQKKTRGDSMKRHRPRAKPHSRRGKPHPPSGKPGGQNLIGAGGRLFSEPAPGPDETSFQVDNTSAAYYNSPYYLKHKNQIQPVPPPRLTPPVMNLSDIVGPDFIAAITNAGKIAFHVVGDTGAAKVNRSQSAATAIAHEASVADAMAADVQSGGPGAPAFFFNLGDVVYNFGEGKYYYDQFYEPFRAYDRPIFAIPGNHDGMIFGNAPDLPAGPSLAAFLRNFCAAAPGSSPDSGNMVRSAMTQPGVYFTLDAPFVSIIGLYSNVLEGPGVISSQGGKYPLTDEQLTFLKSELTRLKPLRAKKSCAVILAVHHPPVSADSKHGGTTGLANDIDAACTSAGLWPDAVVSGHAHLYQRFTRNLGGGKQIPYIVSGSGGFAATAPQNTVAPGTTIGQYTLVKSPVVDFGYLLVTVDMTPGAQTIMFKFHAPGNPSEDDMVEVSL